MTNEREYEMLWQTYYEWVGYVTLFSWNKSVDVARIAIECGEHVETILRILECDPEYHRRQAKHGPEYAKRVRDLNYRKAHQVHYHDLWVGRPMLRFRPLRFSALSWVNAFVDQLILALSTIAVLALCSGWVLQATHSPLCLKPTQPALSAVCDLGEDWTKAISPETKPERY